MSEEDRKLQKHLVDEMMKVSETNPDVMFYMKVLMKKNEGLEQKVEQQEKEIDRLNNIINELEKWLEDNLGNCRTNQNYTSNQIYNLKEDAYYRCLNRLKELKEE